MTAAAASVGRSRRSRFKLGAIERRNLRWGLLFISPWLFGFLALGVFPILYTFFLSLTRYSGFREPVLIGTANYSRLVADPDFWKASYNTLYYTALAVPVGVVVAMLLALAMNQKIREVSIYRAIFYLPSILPVFAISFIFVVLLNPGYGLVNWLLALVGIEGPTWIFDPNWSMPSIILASVWKDLGFVMLRTSMSAT